MRISPNDIISGQLYLRLVEDYKDYDRRQKQIIARMQADIDFLRSGHAGLEQAMERNRELLTLQRRVHALRQENQRLIQTVITLRQKLRQKNERETYYPLRAARNRIRRLVGLLSARRPRR